jgi:sugar phosphate isomerase/epimerase
MQRLTLCLLMLALAGAAPAGEKTSTFEPIERDDAAAEKLGWRLAMQAYTFRKYTLFEAIDKCEALGIRYIELYPGQRVSGAVKARSHHSMSDETMAAIKKKLKDAGIKAVNYGVVGLGKNEKSDRKVFEFAKRMGIETIVSEPPLDAMAGIDKLCKEYGINVALHNHPKNSRYWNPDTVLKASEGRSERIGACADTGHWMRSGVKPLDALKKLEGRIVSLHFKDLNEFNKRGAHDVPWGTGKADARALLADLKRQGFEGVFSIEYEHKWTSNMPELAECVQAFDRYAKQLAAKHSGKQ